MARKGEDLLAELDQLGSEEQPTTPTTTKKPTKAPKAAPKPAQQEEEDDGLADIQAQLAARPTSTSRPATPRLSSSSNSKRTAGAEHTPASSGRTSAENPPIDPDNKKPVPEPNATNTNNNSGGSGGGWWGTFSVSSLVTSAQALAKDLEVERWTSQARQLQLPSHLTAVAAARGLSLSELRERGVQLLSHIAPPISAHERLRIHVTHDLKGYPNLDPVIYGVFDRVMSQVEGGDLLVVQKGMEWRSKAGDGEGAGGYRGGVLGGSGGSGWSDGPWWRDEGVKRDFGVVSGLKEGTRLARVSAEAYAKEFFDASGGVEEAAKKATEGLSESNPVRSSDIFLAIQPVKYESDRELFADGARAKEEKKDGGNEVVEPEEEYEDMVSFAIYLHDPIHSLAFSILSQPFPAKWTAWLDASTTQGEGLPESILEIISSGGVDPREWVAEWIEEVLQLGVGVVAQRYVARRMGVGEGGLGRGKKRAEEESNAGELARTGI